MAPKELKLLRYLNWLSPARGATVAVPLFFSQSLAAAPLYTPVAGDFSLELAVRGATAAVDTCRKMGVPIAVEVADRAGTARALLVMDGVSKFTVTTLQQLVNSVVFKPVQFESTVPILTGQEFIGVVSAISGRSGPAATPCAVAAVNLIQNGLDTPLAPR